MKLAIVKERRPCEARVAASPDTVNTMPEKTLLAFADHGKVGDPLPEDGGDAEEVLKQFEDAGFDIKAMAHRLQVEGAEAFVKSWNDVMGSIAAEAEKLAS